MGEYDYTRKYSLNRILKRNESSGGTMVPGKGTYQNGRPKRGKHRDLDGGGRFSYSNKTLTNRQINLQQQQPQSRYSNKYKHKENGYENRDSGAPSGKKDNLAPPGGLCGDSKSRRTEEPGHSYAASKESEKPASAPTPKHAGGLVPIINPAHVIHLPIWKPFGIGQAQNQDLSAAGEPFPSPFSPPLKLGAAGALIPASGLGYEENSMGKAERVRTLMKKALATTSGAYIGKISDKNNNLIPVLPRLENI